MENAVNAPSAALTGHLGHWRSVPQFPGFRLQVGRQKFPIVQHQMNGLAYGELLVEILGLVVHTFFLMSVIWSANKANSRGPADAAGDLQRYTSICFIVLSPFVGFRVALPNLRFYILAGMIK